MDDLQSIEVLPPTEKKPNNSKFLGKLVGGLLVIGYIALRSGLFGFITDGIKESDRDNAHEAAKTAVVEYYTQPENEPIEDHLARMCSFMSAEFCNFYSEVMPDQYEDYSHPTNCTLDFSEYLEDLDIENTSDKGIAFRVTYTVNFEESGNSDQYNEVIIMVKEDGWKMYDLITNEEYDERTSSD